MSRKFRLACYLKQRVIRTRGLLLLLLFASLSFALDLPSLQPQGHVSDFAQILDPNVKQSIEDYCRRVQASTKAEIAIVTLPRLDGEPIEDIANSLYRRWGIGQKGSNEGVLFLISIEDRRTRLEVGYGLEGVIPDGFAGSLLRQIRPALRERRYAEALTEVARILGERIAQSKNVQITDTLPRRRSRPTNLTSDIPWPMIIAGAVLLLFLFGSMGGGGGGGRRGFRRGGMGPVFLPFPMGGGGYGGGGGGGFGGYDSRDSFGGFGGGDSGGGGASSDW